MADKNGNKNNNKNRCKNTNDFKGDRNGYISLSEAAEYTPYSQEYLSLLSRHGKFRSLKVGRDWVTTINWVEEYLKNQQKNPKDFKGDRNGYISLSEAAEYTPYSQEYLSLRARQGKLKSTKFGRDWMTTINWVADYLREYNGKNGNGTENKKFLENLTKSYGAVLKYGAVTAVLFLIIYFGLSSQNLKLAVGKVFSSTGEKYLVAKDWMKFYWTKQRIKAGQIFVSTKDQANKFLENTKEESFALAQTFASDYKNKIQNFDNGLSAAKNFTTQGMKNFEIKTSGVASQSKIVAKSFVSQGKFVSAVFSDKTKEMGNFITGSLEPVKNLPKVLSSGKNLAKEKFLALFRETSDFYKFTTNKSLAFASGVKNKINDIYSGGRKNVNGLIQQFASLGGKTKSRASKIFNDLNSNTKQFTLNTKNSFLAVYQKIDNSIQNSLASANAKFNHGTKNLTSGLAKASKNIMSTGSNSKTVVLSSFTRTKNFIQENILNIKESISSGFKGSQNFVNDKIFAFSQSFGRAQGRLSQTIEKQNSAAKQFTLASLGAIKNSANSAPVILKHNSQSISQKTRGLFNNTKEFIARNILISKEFALYTFKKNQSFIGEELFALKTSFKNGLFNHSQNIISNKVIAFKDSVSRGLSGFNDYLGKNIANVQRGVVSGSIALRESVKNNINNVQISFAKSFTIAKKSTINGINSVENSIAASFTVARNSVASAIFSTRNFAKQTSQKAVLKTGQGLVMANNKIVEHPAEILSGSVYLGFETAKTKINNNLNLAQQNIKIFNKDLNISLNQASKDMTIPYFAFKEGIQKTKDGTILLSNKTKQSITKGINASKTVTLNIFDRSKKFIGNQILALKTSVNNNWSALNNSVENSFNSTKRFVASNWLAGKNFANKGWTNFSDKLSNSYLALLNYLIPERSLTPTPLVSLEKIVKKSDTGVVVLPTVGGAGISQNKYLLSKIEESFSDEVTVEPSKDGNAGVIKPTQPATPGEEYLYMVVPVKPEVKK